MLQKRQSWHSFHKVLLSNMYQHDKAGNVFLAIKLDLLYLPWSNVCDKRLLNVLDLTFFSVCHLATNIQISHLKYICSVDVAIGTFIRALIALLY